MAEINLWDLIVVKLSKLGILKYIKRYYILVQYTGIYRLYLVPGTQKYQVIQVTVL